MFLEEKHSNDSIGLGFFIAFVCQLATIVITIVLTLMMLGLRSNLPAPPILIWSLLQWVVLLPLYLSCRSKAYPLRAKGILIAGFLGMLLNAACAARLFIH